MRYIRVLNRLIQMHLCLHMVVVRTPRTLVQSCHLDVLDLSLRHSGALSGEEFLLLTIDYAMLHFVRFWCGTLRFGEFLVHNIGLHLGVVLDTLILSDGHLVRRNLDAPLSRMDLLLVFVALAGCRMPLTTSRDMHDAL